MKRDRENSESIPYRLVIADTRDLHGFFPEQIEEIIQDFQTEESLRLIYPQRSEWHAPTFLTC